MLGWTAKRNDPLGRTAHQGRTHTARTAASRRRLTRGGATPRSPPLGGCGWPARQHSRQIGLATSHQFQVRRALRKPSPCPVHQGRPFWPRFAAAARAHPVYRGAGLVGEPRTARVARQHRGRRGPVFVLVRNYWVWWVGRYLQNSDSFGLSPSSIGCLSLRFAPGACDHMPREEAGPRDCFPRMVGRIILLRTD